MMGEPLVGARRIERCFHNVGEPDAEWHAAHRRAMEPEHWHLQRGPGAWCGVMEGGNERLTVVEERVDCAECLWLYEIDRPRRIHLDKGGGVGWCGREGTGALMASTADEADLLAWRAREGKYRICYLCVDALAGRPT